MVGHKAMIIPRYSIIWMLTTPDVYIFYTLNLLSKYARFPYIKIAHTILIDKIFQNFYCYFYKTFIDLPMLFIGAI